MFILPPFGYYVNINVYINTYIYIYKTFIYPQYS